MGSTSAWNNIDLGQTDSRDTKVALEVPGCAIEEKRMKRLDVTMRLGDVLHTGMVVLVNMDALWTTARLSVLGYPR